MLEQARLNLADSNARDLWLAGIRDFAAQARDLDTYAEQVAGTSADLDQAISDARAASDAFRVWLEEGCFVTRTGPSGVGADNYTWYMQNVHLVPYSWEEQVTLMRRELARSHSSMRLEENRNRALPELERIASVEEYDRRLNESVDLYMRFLEEEEVETIFDYMDPALRAVNGSFSPVEPGELRNFFSGGHLPRSGRLPPAHAPLDRTGAHARGPAPEPDPGRAFALQHLRLTLRGAGDRRRGDVHAPGAPGRQLAPGP